MVLIKSSQKAKTFSFCFLLHSFLLPLFCSKCCLLNFNSHPPSTHFHTFTFFGLLGFTQSSAFRISSSTPGSLSHTFTFFSPRVLLRVLPCVSSDILVQLFKKITISETFIRFVPGEIYSLTMLKMGTFNIIWLTTPCLAQELIIFLYLYLYLYSKTLSLIGLSVLLVFVFVELITGSP